MNKSLWRQGVEDVFWLLPTRIQRFWPWKPTVTLSALDGQLTQAMKAEFGLDLHRPYCKQCSEDLLEAAEWLVDIWADNVMIQEGSALWEDIQRLKKALPERLGAA